MRREVKKPKFLDVVRKKHISDTTAENTRQKKAPSQDLKSAEIDCIVLPVALDHR